MKKLIVTLQIAGFAACVALLFTDAPHGWFAASFAVHLAGDLLFIWKEGL